MTAPANLRIVRVSGDVTIENDSSGDIVVDDVGGNVEVVTDSSGERRIEHVKNQYGCEELIMQVIYGGMPPDVAEKSIQLFGREVVPAVHEMGVAATVG